MPGPDFPTGGIVQGVQGIKDAFSTGRGRIVVRGKAEIQETKTCWQIVITEIPYEVIKSQMVKEMDDIRLNKDIDGILDVRDESDRTGMDCLVLWVVDLFDFEAGMIPGLSRKLAGKDILMVAAKRDILPETLSHEKIARFVFGRLKEMGIKVQGLVLTGKLHSEGTEEVLEAVRMLVKGRPVVVM